MDMGLTVWCAGVLERYTGIMFPLLCQLGWYSWYLYCRKLKSISTRSSGRNPLEHLGCFVSSYMLWTKGDIRWFGGVLVAHLVPEDLCVGIWGFNVVPLEGGWGPSVRQGHSWGVMVCWWIGADTSWIECTNDWWWCEKVYDVWQTLVPPVKFACAAVMHLYYARFMNHFMHSLGLTKSKEPFGRMLVHGMVVGETFKVKDTGQYLPRESVQQGEFIQGPKDLCPGLPLTHFTFSPFLFLRVLSCFCNHLHLLLWSFAARNLCSLWNISSYLNWLASTVQTVYSWLY